VAEVRPRQILKKKKNFFSTYFFILRIMFFIFYFFEEKNSDTVPFLRCIWDSKGNGPETALPLPQIPSNENDR